MSKALTELRAKINRLKHELKAADKANCYHEASVIEDELRDLQERLLEATSDHS